MDSRLDANVSLPQVPLTAWVTAYPAFCLSSPILGSTEASPVLGGKDGTAEFRPSGSTLKSSVTKKQYLFI